MLLEVEEKSLVDDVGELVTNIGEADGIAIR